MIANLSNKQQKSHLLLVLIFAFSLRLGVRFIRGEDSLSGQYEPFHSLARQLVAGGGFCIDAPDYPNLYGSKCAYFAPVYPLLIAFGIVIDGSGYYPLIVMQALLGAGTVLCVFLIANQWFDSRVGLLACAFASIYPYYVIHDTSLQETCLFTFLISLSVWLICRAQQTFSPAACGLAGIILGAATLTKVTIIPFVIIYCVSVMLLKHRTIQSRILHITSLLGFFIIVVTPWLVRNNALLGTPVFTSMAGRQLWIANNHYTFTNYPEMSIDFDEIAAWENISKDDIDSIQLLSTNEIGQHKWFLQKGLEYIVDYPALTVSRAVTKIVAAFSWKFNPYRDSLAQIVYFMSYFPILTLGILGLIISTDDWKKYLPFFTLLAAFVVSTALFWSHTSHRTFLDIYMMIFAANAIVIVINKAKSAHLI